MQSAQGSSFTNRYKESLSQPSHVPKIYLEASFWNKDNLGLFDYKASSSHLGYQRFVIDRNCKIYRHAATAQVSVIEEDKAESTSLEKIYIATVLYDDEEKQYRIQSADVSGVRPHHYIAQEKPNLFRNSCLVVSGFSKDGQEGYPLQVGNFVRLGKVEFQVIEVNDAEGNKSMKETSHLEKNQGVHIVESDHPPKGSCKICLCEESSPKNPLIAPCSCKGSCAFVHVECLRSWTNSKIKKEVANLALSYNFSKFECELCKTLLPKSVRLTSKAEVRMLDYEKSNRPYIILEGTVERNEEEKDRIVHVLFPSQCIPVKLGRGHGCSIKIEDITVSRVHAEISFARGKFYITDMNSKFGTLVKFREELALKEKLRIQSGRTVLTFSLIKSESRSRGSFKKKKDSLSQVRRVPR